MISGFNKVLLGLLAAWLLTAAWGQTAKAAEIEPARAVGDIVADLTRQAEKLHVAAMSSKEAAFWSAAARVNAALANLELLLEGKLGDAYKKLDDDAAGILKDLTAIVDGVGSGDYPAADAFVEIQRRMAKALEARFDRPMPQVLSWSPHAVFNGEGAPLTLVLGGQHFDKSYYVPELVVKDANGKETWLSPAKNGASELVFDVPSKYFTLSEREITRFQAAVVFTVQTGGFLGMMKSEKDWRNKLSVLLLPSQFVTVSGALLISQNRQDAWRTSEQVCHSGETSDASRSEYECFSPRQGFKIDLSSAAYAVERTYKAQSSGGVPATASEGSCDLAADAEHEMTAERICMVCEPATGAVEGGAIPCAKLRWKEVQVTAQSTELPLNRFSLDGRNPSRLIVLPGEHDGVFRLRLSYFNGDSVTVDKPFRDDWVQVAPQPQRNAIEVRMSPQVRFD